MESGHDTSKPHKYDPNRRNLTKAKKSKNKEGGHKSDKKKPFNPPDPFSPRGSVDRGQDPGTAPSSRKPSLIKSRTRSRTSDDLAKEIANVNNPTRQSLLSERKPSLVSEIKAFPAADEKPSGDRQQSENYGGPALIQAADKLQNGGATYGHEKPVNGNGHNNGHLANMLPEPMASPMPTNMGFADPPLANQEYQRSYQQCCGGVLCCSAKYHDIIVLFSLCVASMVFMMLACKICRLVGRN